MSVKGHAYEATEQMENILPEILCDGERVNVSAKAICMVGRREGGLGACPFTGFSVRLRKPGVTGASPEKGIFEESDLADCHIYPICCIDSGIRACSSDIIFQALIYNMCHEAPSVKGLA